MVDEAQKSWKHLVAVLTARAWQDDEYRRRLVADPKALLHDEFAIALPPDVQVTVVEEPPAAEAATQSAGMIYLVIPAKPVGQDGPELTDEELSAVAGGIICWFCCCGGEEEATSHRADARSPRPKSGN